MIWIYVWWMWVGASLLLHVWELATPCGTERSPLSVSFDRWLWIMYVCMYVCMYVWDLSSTLAGRLVAFLWFVCPFKYLVWTLLCWYVLISFPLWLCLCDISSIPFDLWYSFSVCWSHMHLTDDFPFSRSLCFPFHILLYVSIIHLFCYISVHWAF